jgi:hypothetical protein
MQQSCASSLHASSPSPSKMHVACVLLDEKHYSHTHAKGPAKLAELLIQQGYARTAFVAAAFSVPTEQMCTQYPLARPHSASDHTTAWRADSSLDAVVAAYMRAIELWFAPLFHSSWLRPTFNTWLSAFVQTGKACSLQHVAMFVFVTMYCIAPSASICYDSMLNAIIFNMAIVD